MTMEVTTNKRKLLSWLIGGVVTVALVVAAVFMLPGYLTNVSEVQITNLTDTGATITWTTDRPVMSSVTISPDPTGQIYYDDRDVEEVELGVYKAYRSEKRMTHHVTIRNLNPETKYTFTIKSNQASKNIELKDFTTLTTLDAIASPDPVYGKVNAQDGTPVMDGYVVLQKIGEDGSASQFISAYVRNGTYSLDVQNVRNFDLTEMFASQDSDGEVIEYVIESKQKVYTAKYAFGVNNDQPVDDMFVDTQEVVALDSSIIENASAAEESGIAGGRNVSKTPTPKAPVTTETKKPINESTSKPEDTTTSQEKKKDQVRDQVKEKQDNFELVNAAKQNSETPRPVDNEKPISETSNNNERKEISGIATRNGNIDESKVVSERSLNDKIVHQDDSDTSTQATVSPNSATNANNIPTPTPSTGANIPVANNSSGENDCDNSNPNAPENSQQGKGEGDGCCGSGSFECTAKPGLDCLVDGDPSKYAGYGKKGVCGFFVGEGRCNSMETYSGQGKAQGETCCGGGVAECASGRCAVSTTNSTPAGTGYPGVCAAIPVAPADTSCETTGDGSGGSQCCGGTPETCDSKICLSKNSVNYAAYGVEGVCADPSKPEEIPADAYCSRETYCLKEHMNNAKCDTGSGTPSSPNCIVASCGYDNLDCNPAQNDQSNYGEYCNAWSDPLYNQKDSKDSGKDCCVGGVVECNEGLSCYVGVGENQNQSQEYRVGTCQTKYVPSQSLISNSLGLEVYAQESQDTDNLEPGVYEIASDKVNTKSITVTEAGPVRFFYDFNNDGIRQEDEPYAEGVEDINLTINKVADVTAYQLNIGWNAIHLPMVMQGEGTSNVVKASDLIREFNAQGANVTHVTTYRSGKFLIYSSRLDANGQNVEFGEDFNLLPGEGYFVRNYAAAVVSLKGNKPSGSLEVVINNGWNLVGVYNQDNTDFSGFQILTNMNTQGIQADVLSKWESGQYSNIVQKDGVQYGNDYKVYPAVGYWVRVQGDGQKKFRP